MTATGKEYTNALEMSSSTSAVKANKMPADKKIAAKSAAPAATPAPAPAAPKAAKKAAPKKETPRQGGGCRPHRCDCDPRCRPVL